MNCDIRHYGRVEKGIKIYFNPDLYRDQLASLEGKDFCEVIKQKHKKPSNNQYGFYRGGILPTCYQTEMFNHLDNKDSIHEDYFAPKFLGFSKMVEVGGKKYEFWKVRSLADLTEKEMSEFITRVLAECDLNGIEIPSPEQYYSKYYNKK